MARWSLSATLLAAVAVAPAEGNVFLGAHPQTAAHSMAQEIVKQALSSELALLSSERTRAWERELRPLFDTLPKNELGNLDGPSVRYALHRFFTKKHGWSVKGLSREGRSWNASSPTAGVMKEQVPMYLHSLMEERVHGHGLNLEELAVFAATLDDLILGEARSDIAHIYENLNLPMVGYRANAMDEEAVMGRFLVAYMSGFHEDDGNYQEMLKEQEATFFSWKDVKMFAEDQQHAFDMQRERQRPFASGLSFDDHVDVAQNFVRNFMAYQHTECNVWKNKLLDLEYQGSGRVRLVDFYSGRRRSDWSFLESQDYLRTIGALDESIPGKPSVIIPNYITGPSNCLSPSEFYNVCCRDECEDMMAAIEEKIDHPSAMPGDIIEIVSNLPSDTVDAPRNLSSTQVSRLQEIADHHSGQVPLHGRLFAQWMHHAYPRECPFPHVSGTTTAFTMVEWADLGREAEATSGEMSRVSEWWSDSEDLVHDLMPWHGEEELVSLHKQPAQETQSRGSFLRMVFFVLGGISVSAPLVRAMMTLRPTAVSVHLGKDERHLV